ncbi:MAG: translation initiation factor IF-2 [Atopobiaceae bacterium]|nr:translation initiation factor IF-2 [Atopobiaceae bacterium]
MAKTRVHDLAKEYGMSSKEMLDYLDQMKIPAKSPSSTLEDVYVNLVRKKLKPILEARAAEIEAQKKAEEEAKKEEERKAAEEAERERVAAEKRRAQERAVEEQRRREAEAARKKAEEERAEQERKAKEKAEKNRVRDTAPKSVPSFTSLLDQIAQQEKVLKQQEEEKEARKKQEAEERAARKRQRPERRNSSDHGGRNERSDRGGRGEERNDERHERNERRGFSMDEVRRNAAQAAPAGEGKPDSRGENRRRNQKHSHRQNDGEDRYTRMARAAEEYNREHVLEEARAAVEEASRESTGRRKRRKERRVKQAAEAAEEKRIEEAVKNDQDLSQLDTIKVPQGSTVAELAELLKVPANDIIKRLFLLGTPLTMTQSMTDDQIELIADDLGRDVKVMTKEEENSFSFYDDPKDLVPRPPVVTVMGHVDHGKTSLLDAIRHTGVAAGEAGGITQAIGASQVKIHGRTITFIDTPGHATFTAMRARGAKVTDIVILIVAADDGVMPQTIESINHAKAANVPIIVAVNKIDKPGANPDKVRQELTEYGIIPEEWGGQNMFVNISAKKKIGIEDLLEAVLLEADYLELKANPNTFASGYVLEAKLDRGRGSVATILVNRGTLHVGDAVVAGTAYGRVRAMLDQHGNNVAEAKPSDPVEILGLQSIPNAGDEFRVFDDERDARQLAEQRQLKARIEEQNKAKHVTLENLFDTMEEQDVKELNLIIKADVQGSIEALVDALSKLDQSEVRINVIHTAVGAINETDVILADASNAIIIGFGVRPDAKARQAAEKDGVEIRTYSVIYKAIEEIDAARIGMLKPTEEEKQTATIEVRQTYKVPKVGIAAGCMVQEGEVSATDQVRLVRNGIVVYDGTIASLRRYKDEVKSVKAGYECGISLENYQDIHVGDTIESYKIVEVARTE